MRKRYICPKHQESTPSAVVYGDGYHCFGCGARGEISELGLEKGERPEPEYVEDIKASIESIKRLPKRNVRGFDLHCNDRGYYLLWPNADYYKFRSFTVDTPGGKYRGPSGHKKPPFVAGDLTLRNDRLVLIEGEFNAISFSALETGIPCVSPGGAGDFYSRSGDAFLREWAKFQRIDLVVDNDAAGFQAAIESKVKLLQYGCTDIRTHFVDKDFNDEYVEKGKASLRETVERMGLL